MIGQVDSSSPTTQVTVAPDQEPLVTAQPKAGQLGSFDVTSTEIDVEYMDEYLKKYRNETAGTCLGLCVTLPVGFTVGLTLGTIVNGFAGVMGSTMVYAAGAAATWGAIKFVNKQRTQVSPDTPSVPPTPLERQIETV